MGSREELEEQLVAGIADALKMDIDERGKASLLVSGGSTPKNLFQKLSKTDLEWSKVVISLVDERYLPEGHKDQNGTMVKSLLLQNKAAHAEFIPLVNNAKDIAANLQRAKEDVKQLPRPFTVVILGMGADGHTASLFPQAPQLDLGMDLDSKEDLILTEPTTAPYERITFTRKALLDTRHLVLHCYGADKKEVLNDAMRQKTYRPYPIEAFLHQDIAPLEVHWTE
ncbi:MAG: 6-phosphogluconolactonase [Cryomorphaceae bacterium]